MNRTIKKLIAILSLVLLSTMPTVQAEGLDFAPSESELIGEETFQKDDLYITVSLYEETSLTKEATLFSNTYEKSGKRTYTVTNDNQETLFTFTVHGTFSVNPGVSATCTKSSYSYAIADNSWKLENASSFCSGNQAIADAKFVLKILSITTKTYNAHVVLTCDANGNFS